MSSHEASETVAHPDGRVELRAPEALRTSPLYNADLAPVAVAQRDWTTYNYAALWISMAHCIPTYMLASGLMTQGMNWQQALFTILLGNAIVLVPILLNSHPGTKYGIPFPVYCRSAFGLRGANIPAVLRALVACGGLLLLQSPQLKLRAFLLGMKRRLVDVLVDESIGQSGESLPRLLDSYR